jgi:hypothetical protein
MREFWPEVTIGFPCLLLAMAARVVFSDGDTVGHLLCRTLALGLLALYAAVAVSALLRGSFDTA